jgi:pyruvate/2-oxoglutarate dehydrogenase complex dihydrolipoamide acyltransferase (E2) component
VSARGVGRYRSTTMSALRRISVDSFDAIRPGHPMLALCEFDVTEVLRDLRRRRAAGARVSLFAFVVKAAADTLAEDISFNSTRAGRRIVAFEEVDVNLPVETDTAGERIPRQITVRDAANRSVEQIWAEVHAARQRAGRSGALGREDRRTLRMARTLGWIPRPVRTLALRAVVNDPFRIKRMSGTTLVTSVGSFGDVPGFAIPYLRSPRAVSFVVGNVSPRPAVVDGSVCPREILSMTVVFNHDIVDGAPAARFVSRLRRRVERPLD